MAGSLKSRNVLRIELRKTVRHFEPAARIREMAEFFRFMQRRLPELLDGWEGQRKA